MNEGTRTTIQSTFEASNQGTIHFGQVIGQLVGAGVESYQVDYRSGHTNYYLPDGSTADFSFERPQHGIADTFDGDAVRATILGAQPRDVPRIQEAVSARRLCSLHGLDCRPPRHRPGPPGRDAR